MRPRIVIVDDDPAFLETVRHVLEGEGFEVVGEARTGVDGVATAAALAPDLVLVDVGLPDMDGFEVVERLAGGGGPPVVLTSIRAAVDYGGLLDASPARGFITKADITGAALARVLDRGAASP